jgi:hypothetical protein
MAIRAVLTEYGIPVERRATVRGTALRPDGTTQNLILAETEPGIFRADVVAPIAGVYHVQIRATGLTMRSAPFTRDAYFTGVAVAGGDHPNPSGVSDPDGRSADLCTLLDCLLGEPSLVKFMERQGVEPGAIARCVERYCESMTGRISEPVGHREVRQRTKPRRASRS